MTEVTLVKHFPVADYAVVNRGTEHQSWVACWGFRPTPENQLCREGDLVTAYWAQGHYFDNEAEALKYAFDRETEAISEVLAKIYDGMLDLEKTMKGIGLL